MIRDKTIEVIARVAILYRGRILLCQSKGTSYYFLPGGHVEFKEPAVKTLKREIKEEIGASLSNIAFLDTVEQIYKDKGRMHHEINLVFRGKINKSKVVSLESHIDFFWKDIKDLPKIRLLPKLVKACVLKLV